MLNYLLLGLLAEAPQYGYALKAVFEEFLGGMWPLNIGQVYVALSRLESQGLIGCELVTQELLPDRKVYSLTDAGRVALERWVDQPTVGPIRMRDEFFLKILLRSRVDPNHSGSLVAEQRRAHMRTLAELSQLRQEPDISLETALLLDGAALRAEADLKWLDLFEERLAETGR